MAENNALDSLDKVDGSVDVLVKLGDSKKYKLTKRKINYICNGLTVETKDYLPKKSIEQIDLYVRTKDKMTRILYSEISNHLFNLEPEKRVIFLTNVEKLLIYSLGEEDSINEDVAKIVVKIYDHTQLVNYQIESMNNVFAQRIADAKVDLHSEIKGVEKEYITILGIFAAIMLAFVGSFTFSTSVLNNLGSVNIFELIAVALVIGVVFILLISLLIEFLREINDKSIKDNRGRSRWSGKTKIAIIVLVILAGIALISVGISKMSFPNDINLFGHKYQIVENASCNPPSNLSK